MQKPAFVGRPISNSISNDFLATSKAKRQLICLKRMLGCPLMQQETLCSVPQDIGPKFHYMLTITLTYTGGKSGEPMWRAILSNIKSTFWISLVLLVILAGFSFYSSGIEGGIEELQSISEMLIFGPFVIFGLLTMQDLREWGFRLGDRSSKRGIDKVSAATAKLTKSSEKKYAALLENAVFSREEAAKLRATVSPAAQKVLSELQSGDAEDTLIPTYVYRMGLPGDFAVMERPSEMLTCAKIVGNTVRFYDCERSTYTDGKKVGKKIAEIPVGAILGLRVLDLASDRVARKIGAFVVDRLINKFTLTAVGVRAEKTNVNAALFTISYVNHDGVIMEAEFFFPSNCKVGDMARKSLFRISQGLDVARLGGSELSDALSWVGLNDDMSNDAYGEVADSIQEGMYDASAMIRWVNLLQGSDQAVGTAKVSADMFASVVLDKSITLKVMSDEDLADGEEENDSIVQTLSGADARKALKAERTSFDRTKSTMPAANTRDPERKKQLEKKLKPSHARAHRPKPAYSYKPDFDVLQFFISILITFFGGVPHLFLMQFMKFLLTTVLYSVPAIVGVPMIEKASGGDETALLAAGVYGLLVLIYIPAIHAFNSGLGMDGMDRDLEGYYRNWFLKLLEFLMVGAVGTAVYIAYGEQWIAALQ